MESTEIAIITTRPDFRAGIACRLNVASTHKHRHRSLSELLGASRDTVGLALVDVLALLEPFSMPLPLIPQAPVPTIFVGWRGDLDGFVAAYTAGVQAYPLDILSAEALGGPPSEAAPLVQIHEQIGPSQMRRIRAFLIRRFATRFLLPSEARVFELVLRGYDNWEIATELRLKEQTVRNTVFGVFRKLGISSRAEAIAAGGMQAPCGHCAFEARGAEPFAVAMEQALGQRRAG